MIFLDGNRSIPEKDRVEAGNDLVKYVEKGGIVVILGFLFIFFLLKFIYFIKFHEIILMKDGLRLIM